MTLYWRFYDNYLSLTGDNLTCTHYALTCILYRNQYIHVNIIIQHVQHNMSLASYPIHLLMSNPDEYFPHIFYMILISVHTIQFPYIIHLHMSDLGK